MSKGIPPFTFYKYACKNLAKHRKIGVKKKSSKSSGYKKAPKLMKKMKKIPFREYNDQNKTFMHAMFQQNGCMTLPVQLRKKFRRPMLEGYGKLAPHFPYYERVSDEELD